MTMAGTETFMSFFSNRGLVFIGANIVKHLGAEDLVAFMQAKSEFANFVDENGDIRCMFLRKALAECRNRISGLILVKDVYTEKVNILWLSRKQKMALVDLVETKDFSKTTLDVFQNMIMTEIRTPQFLELGDIIDEYGRTALHYASCVKATQSCLYFTKSNDEQTTIAFKSNIEVVKILCQNMTRDQIGMVDKNCKTALHIAIHVSTNVEIIRLLTQHMKKDQIVLQDKEGKSALYHACTRGQIDTNPDLESVPILCQNMTQDEVTGTIEAMWYGGDLNKCHAEIVKILRQYLPQCDRVRTFKL